MGSTAFIDITAILLPEEKKNIYGTFLLPVPLHPDSTSNIKSQSRETSKLENDKILI